MKVLLHRIFRVVPFFLPFVSLASGPVFISGETSDGWSLAIEEIHSTSGPDRYMYNVTVGKVGEGSQLYKDEPLEWGTVLDKKSGLLVHTLTCPANCKSPLAGTMYEIHPFQGSCEKGDPEYQYICVVGCEKLQHVPRKLISGYWEC